MSARLISGQVLVLEMTGAGVRCRMSRTSAAVLLIGCVCTRLAASVCVSLGQRRDVLDSTDGQSCVNLSGRQQQQQQHPQCVCVIMPCLCGVTAGGIDWVAICVIKMFRACLSPSQLSVMTERGAGWGWGGLKSYAKVLLRA